MTGYITNYMEQVLAAQKHAYMIFEENMLVTGVGVLHDSVLYEVSGSGYMRQERRTVVYLPTIGVTA